MKVKIRKPYDTKEDEEGELVDYITKSLDGIENDRGALESAQATTDNVIDLLGKLIDVLAAKTTLTDDDLSELFGDEVELQI